MSKVVKGVGRAIGKVVKGATKLVKKVAKSKLGKIAIMAAAIYFGVPAIMGAFGGAAGAGASGLAGAMNGISGAWSGLTGAASSAMAGNFAQAGSQLSAGITGAGSDAMLGGGDGLVGASMQGSTAISPTGAGSAGVNGASEAVAMGGAPTTALTPPAVQVGAGKEAAQGMVAKFMSSPYAAPAAINAGSQVLAGYGAGKARQAELDRADQLAAEDRARYNTNVGTRLWGAAPRG